MSPRSAADGDPLRDFLAAFLPPWEADLAAEQLHADHPFGSSSEVLTAAASALQRDHAVPAAVVTASLVEDLGLAPRVAQVITARAWEDAPTTAAERRALEQVPEGLFDPLFAHRWPAPASRAAPAPTETTPALVAPRPLFVDVAGTDLAPRRRARRASGARGGRSSTRLLDLVLVGLFLALLAWALLADQAAAASRADGGDARPPATSAQRAAERVGPAT